LHYFPFEELFRLQTSGALSVTVAYLIQLGHFKMEPHELVKYSKSLDPDEIEEVLLDEKSDEELEDRDLRISNLARVICSSRNTSGLYSARIQCQYRSAYLLFCLRYRVVCCSYLWHRSCLDHLLPHAVHFIIDCHPVIQFCIV
jgi:hypothetical protein